MPGITWRRGFRSKDGQTIEVEEAVIERKDLEEIIMGAVSAALDEYVKANEPASRDNL